MKMRLRCAVLAAALALAAPALADPGHEIRIEDLNKLITANPAQAELYFQRAMEYREVPRLAEARADLEKVLSLKTGFLPAERELARLEETGGHLPEAISRLERALTAPAEDQAFHVPSCYETLTGLYLSAGRNEDALTAVEKVFALSPQDASLDDYLLRSEAQRRLGKHADRVRDLLAGQAKLKSALLRFSWIDALIDAGRTAEALPEIEKELPTYRYKSSWFIRRARVYLLDGKKAEAAADLDAALTELNRRILPENPEPSLICDRALIHALQGRFEEARKDLSEAKIRGAFEWATRTVEAALEAAEKKSAITPK